MADFDAPSFSLGLDLDADVPQTPPESPIHATASRQFQSNDGTHDVPVAETPQPNPLSPTLRSVWRELPRDVGDSPGEMSSQEARQKEKHSMRQSYSACGSSKLFLHCQTIQSTQSAGTYKDNEYRSASIASTSGHSKTAGSQWMSPKSTTEWCKSAPYIRHHQKKATKLSNISETGNLQAGLSSKIKEILDTSTSDNFCNRNFRSLKDSYLFQGIKEVIGGGSAPLPPNCHSNEKDLSSIFHTENLWEDLSSKKKEKLDAPAFDDFCGVYFRPVKDLCISQGTKEVIGASNPILLPNCFSNETKFHLHRNNSQEDVDCYDEFSNPLPPAYRYFFHNSPKIQRLVRDRFHYFFPLSNINGAYLRPVKDLYISQFTKEVVGASSPVLPPNCFSNETKFHLDRNSHQEDVNFCRELSKPLPPAYRYFFHNSQKIQRLVRDRLHYFFPLGTISKAANQQSETSVIDYKSQFDLKDIPVEVNRRIKQPLKESSKGKNKLKNVYVQVSPQASGCWVNSKSCSFSMKDAGKLGLHMEGHSSGSGHWYTSQDGTKVYVTKTGHELTGQTAYRKYRKESSIVLEKSRKKTTTKKSSNKTAAKLSSSKASHKNSNKTGSKKSSSKASAKKSSCKPAGKKRSNQGSTSSDQAKRRRL